jgi:hypothetical protein
VAVPSKMLAEIIAAPPSKMNRGAAMFALRETDREWGLARDRAPWAGEFLQKFIDQPVPDRNFGQHPRDAVRPTADDLRRADSGTAEPLSPVELAWLERLPKDPAAIPFEDATVLAGMVQRLSPMTQPADARYVRDIWEPVADLHDKRILNGVIAVASRPLPDLPSGALDALKEAVGAELTAAAERGERSKPSEYEVLDRARDLLKDALNRRDRGRLTTLHNARAQLDRLNAKAAARKELVR